MTTRLVAAPHIDFSGLRRELGLPDAYPDAAQREADESAARVLANLAVPAVADRTDIPFVTIDPPGALDLDQAICLRRLDRGYRVFYAIADVTPFVPQGGALEAETWRRGATIYLPDGKVPLHPFSLSEGAASLLPGQLRRAVLWTIDLDSDGTTAAVRVERAIVSSRARFDYTKVQADAANGTLAAPIALLPEVGALLIARSVDRGAINLPVSEQELVPSNGGYRLEMRATRPVEEWNAQISLLTGAAAAAIMLKGGIGLLRTMPTPTPAAVAQLRAVAAGLGLSWPAGAGLGWMLASIDPASPAGAALADQAAELLRGAGYTAFDETARPAAATHAAVGGPYAHVTAPLRRLGDRYATEVCLSLVDGRDVPEWVRRALPALPDVLERADRKASAAESGAINLGEAVLLQGRLGEQFDAVVLDVEEPRQRRDGSLRPAGAIVAIQEPAVRARCVGALRLGERVRVRLARCDPARRLVEFDLPDAA